MTIKESENDHIIDVKIYPNTKPIVASVFRNNVKRNFNVHNPFKFTDFGITELDELGPIIQKKKNSVVKDLMTSLSKRYERLNKIPEELGIQSALPAPVPEQASSQTLGRKRKHMELEPEVKVPGLECNKSLPKGVPFVNNMVRIDSLVSYLVMASMVKTEENARFSLKLRKLIADHPDQEKIKSKKVNLKALGYHSATMGDENPITPVLLEITPNLATIAIGIPSSSPKGTTWERKRLRLFQFSLCDQASNWLERLPAGSISTWEDLTTRFLAQFFLPGRTVKLRNDILIGPYDTQCCMENLKQAFVEYASSRTDKAGEGMVSELMTSLDARLSKFEADFKQQQSEMTNKIDTVLKGHHRSNSGHTAYKVFLTSLLQTGIGIEPQQPEEPKPTLEDEFQDLHLNLPVLEVLAHAPIYNALLDKYVESLELGKNGSAFVQ
ncbi:retrovirus-related pol polyprotein from transposon TNT 1-94 [Tanacetum coccineum]